MKRHPNNKADRHRIGKQKSVKRVWWDLFPETQERDRGMHRDTTKTCSCPYCCGNPRRQRGSNQITRQELDHLMRHNDES